MQVDKETAEAMTEAMKLRELTESEGWKIARSLLDEKISVLDSVSTIPEGSFEEVGKQAMYRAHAISLIRDWLSEIEGRLEQDDQQKEVIRDNHEEVIVRFHSTSM